MPPKPAQPLRSNTAPHEQMRTGVHILFMGGSFMKRKIWNVYALWAGLMIGTCTALWWMGEGSQSLNNSNAALPGMVHFAAWGLVYLLLGFSAVRLRLYPVREDAGRYFYFFLAQLTLNFLWGQFCFDAGCYGSGLIWLVYAVYLHACIRFLC